MLLCSAYSAGWLHPAQPLEAALPLRSSEMLIRPSAPQRLGVESNMVHGFPISGGILPKLILAWLNFNNWKLGSPPNHTISSRENLNIHAYPWREERSFETSYREVLGVALILPPKWMMMKMIRRLIQLDMNTISDADDTWEKRLVLARRALFVDLGGNPEKNGRSFTYEYD
ncbi:hypothetical protein FA15DRAFT_660503 [Coprinopsis marcescibilis]|uniref:Uncharacterized protein n=1 Tax=Coprinopsis marcescibilis TaxID=230819 RepID=A0A5C3KFQ6_COPMA|nr:hypothetical protein FA15DRAFT_660503 [Coprinopsis marcescibilis]